MNTIPTTNSSEQIVNRLKFALELPPANDAERVAIYVDIVREMLGHFTNDQYLQDFLYWLLSEVEEYKL